MSRQQMIHYNQLPEDLGFRGQYIAICEHYLYLAVDILGSDIEEAINNTGIYGLEKAIEYLNELYFGENGVYQIVDGRFIKQEYFTLPLAPCDSEILYDEISYE